MARIEAPDAARVYQLYLSGVAAKSAIDLYDTVNRNERFYAGDQWYGVNAPDLPKPVVNFIKRACQQKIANVGNTPAKVQFLASDLPARVVTGGAVKEQGERNLRRIEALREEREGKTPAPPAPGDLASESDAAVLTAMFEMDWQRLKMDYVNRCGLLDACVSGDYVLYGYWDPDAETGQESRGRIAVERIDSVNYYPTNVNDPDVQKQPSVILARRELLSDVKAQAKRYGAKPADLQNIAPDWERQWEAGDMAQRESFDPDAEKCTTLLYLWRDAATGRIFAQKTCRACIIRPAWDTLLKRYPICSMNWELRKNSAFGRAEITGLIPNQVVVNRIYAMAALSIMQNAFPKVLYSQAAGIHEWSNDLTRAIPVNVPDVSAAAKYLSPASMASDAYAFPEKVMRTSMELIGANDVEMGNTDPVNTSAFLLAKQQAEVPLQTVANRFYAMMEEFALNWLDMTFAYLTAGRWVTLRHTDGTRFTDVFAPERFRTRLWSVEIQVGGGVQWSYGTVLDQLGKALQAGQIDFETYLRAMPEDYFPNREQLLTALEKARRQKSAPAGGARASDARASAG